MNPLSAVFITLQIKLLFGHLKDMGEVSMNLTEIVQNLEFRIMGGTKASLNQYPFNVQFFNFGGVCMGVILTSKTVLTAAHCFDFNTNVAEMRIFSNSRFIFDYKAVSHEVWDYIIHERYNQNMMFANDVAVIIIHDNFTFGPTVQKAILSNSDIWMRENETLFVATGWGETEYGGELSQDGLLKTELRFISSENCTRMNNVALGPDMFCLYGDGKRDTCKGDSGGGILWHNVVVGIVSHGNGCAKTPSMYANVYYLRPWIRRAVAHLYNKYCKFHKFNDNKVLFRNY